MARSRFLKITGILVGMILATVLVFSVSRTVESYRSGARRTATRADLKRIMVAMHQYHDEYDSFPPAFVVGSDGNRWHSWRALILPYLEPKLSKQYHFDEPWNGPNNSKLLAHAPDVFRSDCVGPPENATSYFAVVGKRTLWPAHQSLRYQDIHDGMSNTIAVVEDSRTDIPWLEPRDMLPGEFFRSFYHGIPCAIGGRSVALADGSVRFLSVKLDRVVLAGLITPSYLSDTFKGTGWPADLLDTPSEQTLHAPVDESTLKQTTIVAAATAELNSTDNQLWAATFQMVWDDLKQEVNGPVQLDQQLKIVDDLNATSFDRSSLSPAASFTARSGVTPEADARLLAELKKKFPDINPPLSPIQKRDSQWGVRLYALIQKKMPFESVFDRFQTDLSFSAGKTVIPVKSFGHDPRDSSDDHTVYRDQIAIRDDYGDDNFIIQLNSVGPQRDEIILALVPPESSLEATWQTISDRIRRPNPKHDRRSLDGNETLQIPILDFSIQKHFTELEGHGIKGFGDPAKLVLAFIDIRLRLDETGADFMSAGEAGFIGEFGDDEYKPDRVRRLIFNRPFFIAMKEPTGTQPWFLGWIANSELMEPFKQE